MIKDHICPYCLEEMKCDHANHIRWCSKNPKNIVVEIDDIEFLNAYNKHNTFSEMMQFLNIKRKTFYKLLRKLGLKPKPYIMTKSAKLKISKGRKEYLKNNPNKHPWKRSEKHKSIPCEYLKQKFKDSNIAFVEEYSPMLDEGRYFSIDIAFPDEKIGIEVNGNQHYDTKTGKLTSYYQVRNDLIESKGWKIINLHYTQVYNFDVNNYSGFIGRDYTPYIKIKLPKENKRLALKLKYDEMQKAKIDLVHNSGIDFTKFGWVEKVSCVINKPTQKVNSWMKRYMLEFYNEKCFKRKNHLQNSKN